MIESPFTKAESLLSEVAISRNLKERCAWAIEHQETLSACIQDLLAYHAGFELEQKRLALLAAKLLAAIAPLLSNSRGKSDFIDEWREGTAPKLRACYDDLKAYLAPKDNEHGSH